MILVLLLPLIAYGAYIFGRPPESPPFQFGYYVIYPKNANITMLAGTDRSPADGYTLLRNTTTNENLPTIYLGELPLGDVAPGQQIIYSDAFCIKNMEAFEVHLIGLNFSQTIGTECLAFYIKNDTDGEGTPDSWIAVWLGNQTFAPANGNQLNSSHYLRFRAGEELPVKIIIKIPEQTSGVDEPITMVYGTGKLYLWFQNC